MSTYGAPPVRVALSPPCSVMRSHAIAAANLPRRKPILLTPERLAMIAAACSTAARVFARALERLRSGRKSLGSTLDLLVAS